MVRSGEASLNQQLGKGVGEGVWDSGHQGWAAPRGVGVD